MLHNDTKKIREPGDEVIIKPLCVYLTCCDHIIQAFKEERSYPGYVWITPGWYQQGWWKADEDYLRSLNCTSTGIEQQLSRSLVLLAHPSTVRNTSSEEID